MTRRTSLRRAGHAIPAIAALLLAGCGGGAPARHAAPAVPVRVAKVARIDAPVTLLASGVVEPVQTVAITPQVTGVLLEVSFQEGDYVRAGQVLFRIDPRPLQAAVEQARANLRRDQAQAAAGRRDDARYAELARLGYVARSQADQIHATALAQAATVQADRAVLNGALLNLSYATIRAPIEGRTGSLLVRRGNLVSPGGGALVVINQVRPVLVRFPVLAQDFRSLRGAVAVHPLRVAALPADSSGEMEFGTLSFLDNAVDSLTGTITGKARFPNPAMRLWPGELVFLTVYVRLLRGVLAVPNAAIQLGQRGSYVYVITADTARMRPVVTGLATSEYTVVTSGLAAGEVVVVDGQSRLNPGARVTILTGPAAAPPEVAAGPGTPPTGYVPGLTPGRAGPSGSAAVGAAAGAPVAAGGAVTSTAPTGGTGTAGVGTGGVAAGARGAGQATGTAVPVTPSTPAPSTGSVTAPAPATTITPPSVPAPSPTTPPTPQAPPATAPITAPTTGSRTGGTSGTGATGGATGNTRP